MANQSFTQGTFYGGLAALTTGTTVIGNIVAITPPEMSREAIETTYTTTSANGIKTYIPGDLKDMGEMSVTCQYNTQLDYNSLFGAPSTTNTGCDTMTVTFPKRATTCGGSVASSAATWSAPVVITKLSPKWEFDSQMLITMTFKVIGAPTYTAAVA
jgi:hypothetical protein